MELNIPASDLVCDHKRLIIPTLPFGTCHYKDQEQTQKRTVA